jgi:transposase
LEKLLEDALIKVSSVASTLRTVSTRDMVEALIAGQRDPQALADLARGAMRSKRAALIEALTGRFDAHHGELARILLDQIDRLDIEIAKVTFADRRVARPDRSARTIADPGRRRRRRGDGRPAAPGRDSGDQHRVRATDHR